MKLIALDGAESIGGTKLYLESGHARILIDFGLNYKQWGRYFEEYLQPRSGRGIHDLIRLGIAPEVDGIYRSDLFPADFQATFPLKLEPSAIFISHAHMDHCGMLGLLSEKLPVYTSPVSAAIMKSMQDVAQSMFYGEMAYVIPRVAAEEDARAIESSQFSKVPACQRPWKLFLESIPTKLAEFLSSPANPGSRARKFTASSVEPAEGHIGGMKFKAWPVDHSIPGGCALGFETDAGWVIYSGDLRSHGTNGPLVERFLKEVAELKPTLLLIEGTRAGRGNEQTTEREVYENALTAIKAGMGELVVADFGPRNVERLLSFLQIAKETGRKLVILTKDAYLLSALSYADPAYDVTSHPNLAIFDDVKVDAKYWDNQVRERHSGKMVTVQEIHKKPGDYILALSFWDMKHLLDIKPNGGIYLYSSSEAYTEEQAIDHVRLFNWMEFLCLRPVGIQLGIDGRPSTTGGYHASGHANGQDLLRYVRTISPQKVVPIHTEGPGFFERELNREFEILRAKNGQIISL